MAEVAEADVVHGLEPKLDNAMLDTLEVTLFVDFARHLKRMNLQIQTRSGLLNVPIEINRKNFSIV